MMKLTINHHNRPLARFSYNINSYDHEMTRDQKLRLLVQSK